MNRKAKGTKVEREVVHRFWAKNWAAIRVAGSGSQRYPSPDVIASNKLHKLGIECKTSARDTIYLSKKEIQALVKFCDIFGLEPWICVKTDKNLFFITIEDLKKTKKGFKVDKSLLKLKGVLFEELVSL